MFTKTLVLGIMSTALLLGVSTSVQARITDAAGDILFSYAGPVGGDLDVLSSDVFFDGTNYTLTATLNGAVGTTPGAFYVWGFDRGLGTARFNVAPFTPTLDLSGILFDSVVILRPDTSVSVNRIVGAGQGATNLGLGFAAISGSTISATISASLLPSNGLSQEDYTWNLWPRVGAGNNNQISDFAPNLVNAAVVTVPEPGSMTLLATALFAASGMVIIHRRRRNANLA